MARGEETSPFPSLPPRAVTVTGGGHTSFSVTCALVDGGEADHRHVGLQPEVALVPLPLLPASLTTLDLVIGAVRPADGLGWLGRCCPVHRLC